MIRASRMRRFRCRITGSVWRAACFSLDSRPRRGSRLKRWERARGEAVSTRKRNGCLVARGSRRESSKRRMMRSSGQARTGLENPLDPEPSPYVGQASCVPCHREISKTHEKSRHARTFHHGRGLLKLPFPERPLADPEDAKVTHNFKREKDKITVETHAGDKVYRTVVEYAFGISDQYVTMVGRDEERAYRALPLSSYHAVEGLGWDRTSADVPDASAVDRIRGVPIKVRDGVVRCLYCHVTFYRDFRDPPSESGISLAAADAAIGCERCHGPGGNHLKAIKGNFRDTAIMNPGAGGATAIGKQCADCHIVGVPEEIKLAPESPRFVRSPGMTFTFSRCFTDSEGGMSCMTCHDAHRDDQGPALFYEKQCLGCHSEGPKTEKPAAGRAAGSSPRESRKVSICPVNPRTIAWSATCQRCRFRRCTET